MYMKKLLFVCAIIYLSGNVHVQAGKEVADKCTDSVEIVGLLRNWNNLSTAEERQQLAEKAERNIRETLFLYCLQDSTTEQPPFSEIHTLIEQSGIPVHAMTKHNVELAGFYQKKDVPGSVEAIRHITRTDLPNTTMQDWFVLGKILNFILTEADLSQCKVMLRLLDELLGEEEKQELLTLKKIRDNFEGKIMLIEMGEE